MNPSDNLEMKMLAEENIIPKVDSDDTSYPLVWRVGNKLVTFSEIEMLYRQAKRQAVDFGIYVAEV